MRNIYELLRQKELEISRLEIEVEALRIAAPLVSYDTAVGNDNRLTPARSTAPSAPIRVPQAVNANPQPVHAVERDDKTKQWPKPFIGLLTNGKTTRGMLFLLLNQAGVTLLLKRWRSPARDLVVFRSCPYIGRVYTSNPSGQERGIKTSGFGTWFFRARAENKTDRSLLKDGELLAPVYILRRLSLRSYCPYCLSSRVYSSRPTGWCEQTLFVFLLRPVRCHSCMRRRYRPIFLCTASKRAA
jgi:hypothetical protein